MLICVENHVLYTDGVGFDAMKETLYSVFWCVLMFVTSNFNAPKFHLHLIVNSVVSLTGQSTSCKQVFH